MEKELRQLLVTVFLWGTSGFMVAPAITDVTMSALCPAEYQCSLAIYLTGFQQAITGVGAVVTTPLMGNLSDKYGRKALLTLPLTLSVFPLVILGYSRATNYFYAYYAVKTLTAIVGEGSVNCLALAYLADKVGERKRASAFGILGGVGSASFVCGTLASRFLSTALTFQVAALFAMSSAVYMRIFLEESLVVRGCVRQPMLKESGPPCVEEVSENSDSSPPIFKTLPSLRDLIGLLKCSPTFSKAAIVCFFNSLAEGGLQVSVLYYLKYRFQFSKNQFADLMLINGVGATLVQLLLMPRLVPVIGEEKLLSIGLFVGSITTSVYSLSWAPWVPYALGVCTVLGVLVRPSISSIVSKQVGPAEQGMVQGCFSGISSFANIIAPLMFTPLTALFLSEEAPFYFPGFSIMCLGVSLMIAFIQSIWIQAAPSNAIREWQNQRV
ncbi:hippocampus abundant transcript 1 protein isoform X1 [Neltuma alba]|uniref:hippocampus abundant transcript 1 protein isoform X1 n=1 Tax=Neltuma alba TaxID=207710 RepID=UPI0010A4AB28|nr:hippocampus abundant transcript 1 protein-like isoform X1 [Prosopis alba]